MPTDSASTSSVDLDGPTDPYGFVMPNKDATAVPAVPQPGEPLDPITVRRLEKWRKMIGDNFSSLSSEYRGLKQ